MGRLVRETHTGNKDLRKNLIRWPPVGRIGWSSGFGGGNGRSNKLQSSALSCSSSSSSLLSCAESSRNSFFFFLCTATDDGQSLAARGAPHKAHWSGAVAFGQGCGWRLHCRQVPGASSWLYKACIPQWPPCGGGGHRQARYTSNRLLLLLLAAVVVAVRHSPALESWGAPPIQKGRENGFLLLTIAAERGSNADDGSEIIISRFGLLAQSPRSKWPPSLSLSLFALLAYF